MHHRVCAHLLLPLEWLRHADDDNDDYSDDDEGDDGNYNDNNDDSSCFALGGSSWETLAWSLSVLFSLKNVHLFSHRTHKHIHTYTAYI